MELKVKNIIDALPVLDCIGSQQRIVHRIVSSASLTISPDEMMWVSDKNLAQVKSINAGSVICSKGVDRSDLNDACTYLIVESPRLYFLNVVKRFFADEDVPSISLRSDIHSTVVLGKDLTIGSGVVIEKGCIIGNNSRIDANTIIKKNTVIGQRVKIGCNNTIGADGFGYEMNSERQFEFIPHLGNVVIEDDVEIGNNTTIDRAVLGSTVLRRNVKVDNLVHIAHGVDIGENSLIIANAMIAGSCVIGKNVWVAPSASILNKVYVGDNATIGMGAVVLKNIEPGQVIVGNPGKDINQRTKS
jgi:UDP-3-O-[3-hydroxymyristoyl] glucosamine N-acyltransferase